MLRKVVIPAAGLGTRLLPATKEQSKEMLPIFTRSADGLLCVKPFLQVVFEELYDVGFRNFCFVVGRGKKSIEDHFTLNNGLIECLLKTNKFELAKELTNFFEKIRGSNIVFMNQPKPRGFGDAVLCAKDFTGGDPFLVHAGDDLILSKNNHCLKRLVEVFEDLGADAVFYVERVDDPRKYGVIRGNKIDDGLYRVVDIEEKPLRPLSNLATIAVYAFSPKIYDAIRCVAPDVNDEIQLTSAIQHMITQHNRIYALELKEGETRIDIGTPESYWSVLEKVMVLNSR